MVGLYVLLTGLEANRQPDESQGLYTRVVC